MRSNDGDIYNYKQKQEYIEYEQTNVTTLRNYFIRVSKGERKYNKDIADMDIEELRDTILLLDIRSENYLSCFLSMVKGYINWAKMFGKTTNNSLIHLISANSLINKNAITSQMLASPAQLEYILNTTLDYVNYENRAKRDSLMVWLIYSGLDILDLPLLEKDDIDFDNKFIKTKNNIKYDVDDRIISLWKHCSGMTGIEKRIRPSKKKNANEYILIELVDNNFLFRSQLRENSLDRKRKSVREAIVHSIQEEEILNKINEESTPGVQGELLKDIDANEMLEKIREGSNGKSEITTSLSPIIREQKNDLSVGYCFLTIKKIFSSYSEELEEPMKISPSNIRASGIFYKLSLLEKAGEIISPKIIAKYFNLGYDNDQEMLAKSRKKMLDYEGWKWAFGYK